MILTPRQNDILNLARRKGRVMVDDLATHFDVTPQTIRKDLNDLCTQGRLGRIHGGAVFLAGAANAAYQARRNTAVAEKNAIGRATAQTVPNNSTLFINIGTTTEQVAEALKQHKDLMVITNNINVINILQPNADIELVVASGVVRHADGGIVGEAAVDFIRQFKVDYAVIGVSAIDADGALLDYDYREVRVAQAIVENARSVILVADRMKFDRSAPVRIGHISMVDLFITDAAPPPAFLDVCAAADVTVQLAAPEATPILQSSQ